MEKKSIKSCLDTNSEPGTEDNIVVNCTDLKSGPGTEDDVVVEGSSGGPYLIEKIVGVYMAKDRKKYYRIKWIDSWEPEENLSEACQSLIIDFWNGTTLDQRGAVVKKDELKEGLRIIKKESFFSSSEGAADVTAEINSSGKNNQELDCTNPTKDLNIDSTFCLNDKRIIANQDKDNQELDGANPTKDLNIDSTIRLNDKKVIANQDKNNQELDCANPTKDINKDSTIRLNDKKIVANQDKNGYFASTPKVCCKDHSTLTDKSNAEISIQSNKQISKPGEGLESRDSVLIDSYGKMYSSPPPLITDDECDQQEEVMESNELQFGPTAKNGNIDTLSKDTDSLSVLHDIETEVSSNLSQNAIQVEESNEDDLEITVSIESPTTTNKLKRGRRSVRQLKKLPIVAHSTNNTHLSNALRTQSNIVPTHPRCQLRHASADDSALVLSPAKRRRRRAASTNPVSEASCNHTLPRRTLFSTQDEVYCDSNSPLGLSNTGQHPLCGQVSSCPQYKDTNFQTGQSKSVEGSPTSALKDRICKICNERFSNITLVRQHVRQKHTSLKSPAPASPIAVTLLDVSLYPCEVCEGLFRSTPDLKSHIQLHKRHNTLTLNFDNDSSGDRERFALLSKMRGDVNRNNPDQYKEYPTISSPNIYRPLRQSSHPSGMLSPPNTASNESPSTRMSPETMATKTHYHHQMMKRMKSDNRPYLDMHHMRTESTSRPPETIRLGDNPQMPAFTPRDKMLQSPLILRPGDVPKDHRIPEFHNSSARFSAPGIRPDFLPSRSESYRNVYDSTRLSLEDKDSLRLRTDRFHPQTPPTIHHNISTTVHSTQSPSHLSTNLVLGRADGAIIGPLSYDHRNNDQRKR